MVITGGAAVGIKINVEGEDLIARRLKAWGGFISDWRPAFRKIGVQFYQEEAGIFQRGGAFHGRPPWEPLAASTIAKKGRSDILVDTGALMSSLTGKAAADSIYKLTPFWLEIGTKSPYSKYHQSPAPRTRLPRRKHIDLVERQKQTWIQIMHKFLVGQAKKAGLDMETVRVG